MFIGVDIGGSNMGAGLFTKDRKLVATAKVKSKAKESSEIIINQLFKVIDRLRRQIPEGEKLLGIGIGVAGIIDKKTSVMHVAANMNLDNVNLKKVLEDKYCVLAKIENDVNVGTIGEWKYGAGRGHKDVVGVFVGTGIGGGLIINGQLYTGNSGLAGEIGHTAISYGGAYCNGTQGGLEAYAAKFGIEKKIEHLASKGVHSSLIDSVQQNGGKLKSSHIKEAFASKDLVALDIFDEAMNYLGISLASVINLLNPTLIVLGGGIMEGIGEIYLPKLRRVAQGNSYSASFNDCDFKLAELGDSAGLYGAMELVASDI